MWSYTENTSSSDMKEWIGLEVETGTITNAKMKGLGDHLYKCSHYYKLYTVQHYCKFKCFNK